VNSQANEELRKSNDEMNKLYLKILEEYKNDSEFVQNLRRLKQYG
jgi:hypothetical protein